MITNKWIHGLPDNRMPLMANHWQQGSSQEGGKGPCHPKSW